MAKSFSDNYARFIVEFVTFITDPNISNDTITRRILQASLDEPGLENETPDSDEVFAHVQLIRGNPKSQQKTSSKETGAHQSVPSGSGSGWWKKSWRHSPAQATSPFVDPYTTGAAARAAARAAAATSGGGGPGGGPSGSGSRGGPGSGGGPGGGGSGGGGGSRGGGGGGGGGPGGGGPGGGGPGGGGPGGGGPGGGGPGGGGPGPGPGGGGPGGGRRGPRRRYGGFNSWQTFNLMPTARSFWGKAGGWAGAAYGATQNAALGRAARRIGTRWLGPRMGKAAGIFARVHGSALGQAAGTVLGDFISKMKDVVVQAREFAVALKEANRQYMYYNASIAMSYIEADVAHMFREMRVARGIAPSVVGLNRAVTAYEATTEQRDIFWGNAGNIWAQAKLMPAQAIQETLRDVVYKPLNSVMGALGVYSSQIHNAAMTGTRLAMIPIYLAFGPVGIIPAMSAFWTAVKEWNNPTKGAVVGAAWENFFNNPGRLDGAEAMFNHRRGFDRRPPRRGL